MQPQPLAFTLVKTIVSARDEGKVLSPALATAWDLLRTELSPAHRVIASEVRWAPTHQEDLRFVIDGIRKQFEKDPNLEGEFLAFLAEVEPFGKDDNESSILPVVIGITSGSTISPPVGGIEFAFSGDQVISQTTAIADIDQLIADASEDITTHDDPAGVETAEAREDVFESSSSHVNVEQPSQKPEAELIQGIEALNEIPASEEATILEEVAETSKSLEATEVEARAEAPVAEPTYAQPMADAPGNYTSVLKYWPLAAAAFVVAMIGLGFWIYAGSVEVQQVEETEIVTAVLADSSTENTTEEFLTEEAPLEYSTPSIARLSQRIDSLRLVGDYAAALTQQQMLANRLEANESPARETAQAYSELAILYSTQKNILQAIVEQRKSLVFAREAYAKTAPELGRSHLKLATFYTENGELHMARAHLQQARHVFGETQELISPTDQKKTDQLAERIRNAS